MSLIWDDEVIRFVPPSDPTEWIDLKKELTSGDDDVAWNAAGIAADGRLTDVRAVVAFNRERAFRSIVSWSYVHNGAPLELTRGNLARLDRFTFKELVERVNELNPLVLPTPLRVSRPVSPPITTAASEEEPHQE